MVFPRQKNPGCNMWVYIYYLQVTGEVKERNRF
jgi:hypothetical protein